MIRILILFMFGMFTFNHAQALVSTASAIRTVYSSTNVNTTDWHELVAKTSSPIVTLAIFDNSGQTMQLAVGAAGFEVQQIIIPPGGGGFPLNIPSGSRVSIRAITATANTGENDISFFYQ